MTNRPWISTTPDRRRGSPPGFRGQRLSSTVSIPGPVAEPPPAPPPPSGFTTDQQAADHNAAIKRYRAAQSRPPVNVLLGDPEAVVEILGRWWHLVYIRHGLLRSGPDGHGWLVFGRRRAERLAARKLAAYQRDQQRQALIIRPGGPNGR